MRPHHIALAIGILIFAWFVWPTPYRYGVVRDAWFCRVNVFTTYIECTTGDGE